MRRGKKTDWNKFDVMPSGCWIWRSSSTLRKGYAMATHDGKGVRVHRRNWIEKNGPIPDGLMPDHLCRNRACVNPDHLELVTNAENQWRGSWVRLSKNEVAEMKKVLRFHRQVEVIKTWRLPQQYVSRIATERTYRGVA